MAIEHVLRHDVAPGLDLGGVETMGRRVRRQEGINQFLRGDAHRLERMRDVKRVEVHHHREQHPLGDPERLDHRVERLLRALRVVLDPAGVALREAVGLVRPERPGRRKRSIHIGHHDRGPRAARVMQQLVHEQQALGSRRREHANASERRRDAGSHHRVLGLGGQHFGIELAVGLEFCDLLENRRLRRDRIERDHLGSRQTSRPRDRVIAGQEHRLLPRKRSVARVHRVSSIIFIEPVGHSLTQRPHPLQ